MASLLEKKDFRKLLKDYPRSFRCFPYFNLLLLPIFLSLTSTIKPASHRGIEAPVFLTKWIPQELSLSFSKLSKNKNVVSSQNTVPVQRRALNNCETAPLQLCTLTTTLTGNALSHFLFTAPVNAHFSIIQRVN